MEPITREQLLAIIEADLAKAIAPYAGEMNVAEKCAALKAVILAKYSAWSTTMEPIMTCTSTTEELEAGQFKCVVDWVLREK